MARRGAETIINRVIHQADLKSTVTKAGWCLKEGLLHISELEDHSLLSVIEQHGIPSFYSCCKASNLCRHEATQDLKDPSNCFESLCRIVVGQFVSGKAAQAAWKRLLLITAPSLTPQSHLLQAGDDIESRLQIPAGLTKSKARCLVDLAHHFSTGVLSEEFLTTGTPDEVRTALLKVKGIGPWSCDMFLQFYLEHSNILALGDLGIRKGLQQHFKATPKMDLLQRFAAYEPYHSLLAYYMWRVVDTTAATTTTKRRPSKTTKRPPPTEAEAASPEKRRRTSPRRVVVVTPPDR